MNERILLPARGSRKIDWRSGLPQRHDGSPYREGWGTRVKKNSISLNVKSQKLPHQILTRIFGKVDKVVYSFTEFARG